MLWELKCRFEDLTSTVLVVCDPSRRGCFRPHLLWMDGLCFQKASFSFPPGGLQDDCFLFVCACVCVPPWRAQDLIWLLSIYFCYLAGVVGGCVN